MRALARLACLVAAALAAAQDVARTRLVPESPAPGQPFRMEITIESEAMDPPGPALRTGAELPMLEEIPLRFAGQRMGGLGARGTTTLLVSGTAPRTPGPHRIPAFALTFAVRKVRIPATDFAVRPLAPGETLGLVEASLELPDRTLTLGETVVGRIVVRNGDKERARGIWSVEARGEGVSFRNLGARSDDEGLAAEFELTPTRAGQLDLRVGAVVLAETQGARGTETRDRPVVLSRSLRVAGVPEKGRPTDWSGAVGRFSAGPASVSKASPEIGEPIRLSVTLVGDGNLDRILPPEVPHGDNWDVLPVREPGRAREQRTFTYQLTPRAPGKLPTPEVRLSAFNPATRAFDRIVFPAIEVEVTGRAPERVELVTADPSAPADPAGPAPALAPVSQLAEVPGRLGGAEPAAPRASGGLATANLAALGLLLAGVAVAARREWVAAHPREVARARGRRAARRARRRLRRCPEASVDATAAEGLRSSAAPLVEGEARAMTAEDVLRALGDAPADAEAIRRCFRRIDGSRFGGAPMTAVRAASDREALAAALLALEGRLCD
jgi:hypothetical protein